MRLSPLQRVFQNPRALALYERARGSPLFWPIVGRTLLQEIREAADVLESIRPASGLRGLRVLDLACGQGTFSLAVARTMRTCSVVGLDLSRNQLRRARGKALEGGRLSFVQADAGCMPFDADTFEAVVTFTSLHQIPDLPAVARELGRVCRPGAALYGASFAGRGAASLMGRLQRRMGAYLLDGRRWGVLLEEAGFCAYRYRQRTAVWGVFEARKLER